MVAVPNPAPEAQLETEAVQRYVAALQEIPLVERISYSVTPAILHFWVLLKTEDEPSERRVVDAEMDLYRALDTPTIDVHFHPMDKIDVDMLPPSTVIFTR